MKAILLAGGYGKRLRPLTNKIPKCLVKINNIPLLEIWINKLYNANVKEVLINTHYLSEKVEKFIKKKKFKIKIHLSYEKKLLGTAGTLINNIDFFENKKGFLIHADNFCKEPLKNIIKAHEKRPRKCILTAMAFETDNPRNCGIFQVDKFGVVKNFYEKPKEKNKFGNLANSAVYLISKEFIKLSKKKFTFTKNFSEDIMPKIQGKIFCYKTKKFFIDIGSINSYMKVKNFKQKIQ